MHWVNAIKFVFHPQQHCDKQAVSCARPERSSPFEHDKVNPVNLSRVFLAHKIQSPKCQRRQKSGRSTFIRGTFLCCAFSYWVLGKSDSSVVVTLQRLLKPDRMVSRKHCGARTSDPGEECYKAMKTPMEDKKLSVEYTTILAPPPNKAVYTYRQIKKCIA